MLSLVVPTMIDIQRAIAVIFLCCMAACNSFQYAVSRPLTRKMTTCSQMQNYNDEQVVNDGMSRRNMIQLATNGIGFALVAGFPSVSLAVVPSQAGKSGLYCFIYKFLCFCTNIIILIFNHLSISRSEKVIYWT